MARRLKIPSSYFKSPGFQLTAADQVISSTWKKTDLIILILAIVFKTSVNSLAIHTLGHSSFTNLLLLHFKGFPLKRQSTNADQCVHFQPHNQFRIFPSPSHSPHVLPSQFSALHPHSQNEKCFLFVPNVSSFCGHEAQLCCLPHPTPFKHAIVTTAEAVFQNGQQRSSRLND